LLLTILFQKRIKKPYKFYKITTSKEGRESAELVTALNKWKGARRFVMSRVLKNEKDRKQMSFLEGVEDDYFFFVTNTELSSIEVVEFYEKAETVKIT